MYAWSQISSGGAGVGYVQREVYYRGGLHIPVDAGAILEVYQSVAGIQEGIVRFTRGLIGGRVGIHVYSPQQPHQILTLPGY